MTFCILEFSRKLAVKSAYPRVLSPQRILPEENYAPTGTRLTLTLLRSHPHFPLSFQESSRSYLNSPSTTLSRLPTFCAFLPPSCLPLSGFPPPSLSLDRRGKFIVDLNRTLPIPQLRVVDGGMAAISTLSTIKELPPRCLSRYFLHVYLCHRLDPPNRPFNLTLPRKPTITRTCCPTWTVSDRQTFISIIEKGILEIDERERERTCLSVSLSLPFPRSRVI